MKVSKKTINKTLIWGGSILIIMVIFYILNRFLNKESFQSASRIRIACTNGKFELNGKCVDGSNDYCYTKNVIVIDKNNSEYQKYYWNPTDKKCIKYVDKLCQSINGTTNGKKYKVNKTTGKCEEVKMVGEEYCKNNREKKFKFDSKLNKCIEYNDQDCKSLNPDSFLGKNKLCIIGNTNNCKKDSSGLKFWNEIDKKCINNDNAYCNTLNPVSFLDKNKLCIEGNDVNCKTDSNGLKYWSKIDKKCIDKDNAYCNTLNPVSFLDKNLCIKGDDVNCKKHYEDKGYSNVNDVFWYPSNKSCVKFSEDTLCPDDYTLTKNGDGFICRMEGMKTNFTEVINNCMNEDNFKKSGNEKNDQNNARFQVENCIRSNLGIILNKETMFDPNIRVQSLDLGEDGYSVNKNNFKSTFRNTKNDITGEIIDQKSVGTLMHNIFYTDKDSDNNNFKSTLNSGKTGFYNGKGVLSNIPSIV